MQVKPYLVCLLALLVVLVVMYLTHHLLFHLDQRCKWSETSLTDHQKSTLCTLHSHSGKDVGSIVVRSVIDGGNMTVAERSKFQCAQVDRFCDKYNLSSTVSMPLYPRHPVYRHLLINHHTETLFCFVPKVGCTNLKVLFFIAQGLLPRELLNISSHRRVKDHLIKEVVAANSLTGLSKSTSDHLVQYYYKYMMYRDPLERLVSAYRNKVQRFPLTGLEDEKPHYNWLRKRVYKHTHPIEYREWFKQKGIRDVQISFPDFITYWLDNRDYQTKRDEHLVPIFDLCDPCRVRYNYYGHFETFEQDAKVLIEQIGTNATYLRQGYYKRTHMETSVITIIELYKELSELQKILVLERLSRDIDFYYHLFPYKQNSHNVILGLTSKMSVTYD